MEPPILIALIISITLVSSGIFYAIRHNRNEERERRRSFSSHSAATPPPTPTTPISDASPETTGSGQKSSPATAHTGFFERGRSSHIKTLLREKKAAGISCRDAVYEAVRTYSEKADVRAIFKAAIELEYPAADLASCMTERAYAASEIAGLLNEHSSLSAEELAKVLVSVVPRDEGAERECARKVLRVVQSEMQLDDEDCVRLLKNVSELGCSVVDMAHILYDETSMGFVDIVFEFDLANEPKVCADLAKELDVDLTDADTYNDFRDGDIKFGAMAKILKAGDCSTVDIVAAEKEYATIDDVSDLEEVFAGLRDAEFSVSEILAAFDDQDLDFPTSSVVGFALDQEVPIETIVAFLTSATSEIDPEELDERMRDDEDIDIETRVKILYHFFAAQQSLPPATATNPVAAHESTTESSAP